MRACILAITVTLLLSGCDPVLPQPPDGPASVPTPVLTYDPTIPPDYTLFISTWNIPRPGGPETPVRRDLTCSLVGLARDASTPVVVVDESTGQAYEYSIVVGTAEHPVHTPARIPIKDYANLFSILFFCTTYNLHRYDHIECEVVIGGDEFGPDAPLLNGGRLLVNRPHFESGFPGLSAACGGRIDVLG